MRRYTPLLAVAGAILCLGALVSTATARTFSVTSQTWRATYRALETRWGESEASRCALTLEGSFHARTMTKSAGSLIGYVTRAVLEACASGSATVLQSTLPWHIQYASFTGILTARITSIRANVINAGIGVREPIGFPCLFRSTAIEPLALIFNTFIGPLVITAAELSGEFSRPAECPASRASVRVSAASTSITVLNSVTLISVRLI
ncbi:MAG TPA: hypothetical protein VF250_11485 [Conexibacter sp.]